MAFGELALDPVADVTRDGLISITEIAEDAALPRLSARLTVKLDDGRTLTEEVKNSRDEVAVDWSSVDDWASALWEESGRSEVEYGACRDAVRGLESQLRLQLLV